MTISHRKAGLLVSLAILGLMLVGVTGVASAATTTNADTEVELSAGTLDFITEITVAPAFNPVTLDGTAQNTTAAFTHFSVKNARGNRAGWNINISASQFTTGGATPDTLATSAISMPHATVAELTPSGPLPTLTAGDYLIGVGSGVKVVTADPATTAKQGNGRYDFDAAGGNFTLSIPADAYAGTYASTVTVDLLSGP